LVVGAGVDGSHTSKSVSRARGGNNKKIRSRLGTAAEFGGRGPGHASPHTPKCKRRARFPPPLAWAGASSCRVKTVGPFWLGGVTAQQTMGGGERPWAAAPARPAPNHPPLAKTTARKNVLWRVQKNNEGQAEFSPLGKGRKTNSFGPKKTGPGMARSNRKRVPPPTPLPPPPNQSASFKSEGHKRGPRSEHRKDVDPKAGSSFRSQPWPHHRRAPVSSRLKTPGDFFFYFRANNSPGMHHLRAPEKKNRRKGPEWVWQGEGAFLSRGFSANWRRALGGPPPAGKIRFCPGNSLGFQIFPTPKPGFRHEKKTRGRHFGPN